MIGALVFLGCPWRASLRLAGGDWNAILGLAGLASGVFIGSMFIKNGFNLGRSHKVNPAVGLIIPGIALILFIGLLWGPKFDDGTDAFRESTTGPGSMQAAVWLSFGIALAVGFFAQRSRFCTIGGIRDTILIRDFHLLLGVGALIAAAFVTNLIFGQFEAGFEDQPVAHHDYFWNYMGMVLAGLAFALAGGCPGRQLILSGEGDADAGVFVLGMVAGAAFSHNFKIAAGPDNPVTGANGGPGDWGAEAVIIGLVVCVIIAIAFTFQDMIKAKLGTR
jgi:YedE family putative selenium metabolism protein